MQTFDALLPPEMAKKAELAGAQKAGRDWLTLLALAVLAGAFIALGAMFATTVLAGSDGVVPFGISRLLAGSVFCLGLILVIVGGAELFTGDTLIVMAWAARQVRLRDMLRVWVIVYAGNFIGAISTAALVFLSAQHLSGGGEVTKVALALARAKATLPFMQAFFLGILCNVLVCLAVWLSFSARTLTDKVFAIIFPVSAFVAAGFEHSVANMYIVPLGIFIAAWSTPEVWAQIGADPSHYGALTWSRFLLGLVPVTIGNIIGGAGLVGAVYWFIYLRPMQKRQSTRRGKTK